MTIADDASRASYMHVYVFFGRLLDDRMRPRPCKVFSGFNEFNCFRFLTKELSRPAWARHLKDWPPNAISGQGLFEAQAQTASHRQVYDFLNDKGRGRRIWLTQARKEWTMTPMRELI